MPEQKYTQDGLPVISLANLESSFDLFARALLKNQIEIEARIKTENPVLYSYLEEAKRILEKDKRNELVSFLAGVYLTYESLRRQSAANRLEREIEGK